MKNKEDVLKTLRSIVKQNEALNKRFKEDFEKDPRFAIKWKGQDVMIYSGAAHYAEKFIAHMESDQVSDMADYIVSQKRQCLEQAVAFDNHSADDRASQKAWKLLWQAFGDILS